MVELGQPIDAPAVPATSGKTVSLADYRGKRVLLYFYPKDNTPGCTTESVGFANAHAVFAAAGIEIFGVSRDSVKSHENFKAKYRMPFELLSDGDEALCRYFDVIKEKNMYGKKVMGIVRSTFLIDADGKLAAAWHNVKAAKHVAEVMAELGLSADGIDLEACRTPA